MGRSKQGKTTSLYFYARSQIGKLGKKILVVNVDGGSEGYWESTDIKDKVRVVYPMKYKAKLAVMRYLSQGMVPKDVEGKKMVQIDLNQYSDVFWEGLTATAEMFMSHLATHEDLQGVKHALAPAGTFSDGDETFSVNSISHYNLVHKELKKLLLEGFYKLPLNVMITALLDEGEDEYKNNVMGPATVGKAITHKVTSWVPDSFHQECVRMKGDLKYRVWFDSHVDKGSQLPVLSGARMIPSMREKFLELYPKGYLPVNEREGLQTFYEFREGLK